MAMSIAELMEQSGVKFGTSGARGLVTAMTDRVCYAYTLGFLQYLEQQGELKPSMDDKRVAVAGDLRASTPRIMDAAAAAVRDKGYEPFHCDTVPSPAVALFGLQQKIPAVMVTGSHIPEDRNGIKYNKAAGEILKDDEAGIKAQTVDLPDVFDEQGMLRAKPDWGPPLPDAAASYVGRYLDTFPESALEGLKLGLYEHSAVGRDLLYEIYTSLGADVVRLGRSERFIPVDTEAIRPEDVELARRWAQERSFDAVVSTDGDSDRPLLADETGKWLRGDVAGILVAQFLGADAVVTPVSCNTAAEKCGAFKQVIRTRIGSPFVVAGMQEAAKAGARRVVGYEANGGFLTASPIPIPGGDTLEALPTRDCVLVHLGILLLARQRGRRMSELVTTLPPRVTASDRLEEFPAKTSAQRIRELVDGGAPAVEKVFGAFGTVDSLDTTDGLRVTFDSGEIVHLRPSGNAPELRCYTEAENEERARQLNAEAVEILAGWRA